MDDSAPPPFFYKGERSVYLCTGGDVTGHVRGEIFECKRVAQFLNCINCIWRIRVVIMVVCGAVLNRKFKRGVGTLTLARMRGGCCVVFASPTPSLFAPHPQSLSSRHWTVSRGLPLQAVRSACASLIQNTHTHTHIYVIDSYNFYICNVIVQADWEASVFVIETVWGMIFFALSIHSHTHLLMCLKFYWYFDCYVQYV